MGGLSLTTDRATAGSRYRYRLGDGFAVPDPASRYSPMTCTGAARSSTRFRYAWQNDRWTGRPWEEVVLYEAHLGCFSPEGSFDVRAAVSTTSWSFGVTALELMPIATSRAAGTGAMMGVLLFAPRSAYGTPRCVGSG